MKTKNVAVRDKKTTAVSVNGCAKNDSRFLFQPLRRRSSGVCKKVLRTHEPSKIGLTTGHIEGNISYTDNT